MLKAGMFFLPEAAGQSALESLAKIAEEKGRPAEPFLVSAFPKILEASNDKSKNVKDAAVATSKTIMGTWDDV